MKDRSFTAETVLALCHSCIPEKVGVNQKAQINTAKSAISGTSWTKRLQDIAVFRISEYYAQYVS
jgi:hypothetical protein